MNNEKRIQWIDIAKGITIILVIIGHLNKKWFPALGIVIDEIYTFHMPLFFMLSGLTFSIKKEIKFKDFFKKKMKSLMLPYAIFSIVTLIKPLGKIVLSLVNKKGSSGFIVNIIKEVFNIYIMGEGLWFLPCLLIAECILYFILVISKNDKKVTAIYLFVLSILGYIYIKYLKIALPFKANVAIIATIFVGIGYLLKDTKVLLIKIRKRKWILIATLINILINLFNYKIYSKTTSIECATNYLFYFLPAISGCFAILGISQRINKNKYLEFLGKNSLLIYIFNDIVLKFYKAIIITLLKIQIQDVFIYIQLIIALVMVILVIFTMIPIIKIINYHFPFLLGKEKIKKEVKYG